MVKRGIFVEAYTLHSKAEDGTSVIQYGARIYSQPYPARLVGELYHGVWEKLTWRLMRKLEPWALRRHEDTCPSCAGDPVDPDGGDEVCSYVPLSNRQDLRCFELRNRCGVDHIAHVPLEQVEHAQISRPDGEGPWPIRSYWRRWRDE